MAKPPPRKISTYSSPKWIEPCIPTLIAKPPKGPNWRHEVKRDGYRISIVIKERTVKVRTRKGLEWTEKFPTIVDDAATIPCCNAIIDAEAVVLDDKGRANFAALQANLSEGGENVIAYVFDLLFLDGQDLRALPLDERRQALEEADRQRLRRDPVERVGRRRRRGVFRNRSRPWSGGHRLEEDPACQHSSRKRSLAHPPERPR